MGLTTAPGPESHKADKTEDLLISRRRGETRGSGDGPGIVLVARIPRWPTPAPLCRSRACTQSVVYLPRVMDEVRRTQSVGEENLVQHSAGHFHWRGSPRTVHGG